MAPNRHDDHMEIGIKDGMNNVAPSPRFSDIPSTLDIPVHIEPKDEDNNEAVEIYLENLSDPNELCSLLETEHAAPTFWMTVALAYAKQNLVDYAIEILIRGGISIHDNNPKGKLSIATCLCWMYLWKSREAPRIAPEGVLISEAKTKEYYLQLAVLTLNEASRLSPSFPPLFLARGVLYLLRSSLQTSSKDSTATGGSVDSEKANLLRGALKSFEDSLRVSQGKNMLAVIGKSRVLFSLGKYAESLAGYQEVVTRMPDFIDPDPRIGIGYCLWKLGFKEDAKVAWERSLEINPNSNIATILIGLYYLDTSSGIPIENPEFVRLYEKAITEYTQKSFKLDSNYPLTCATFARYFLSRKAFPSVESLSNKAIQYTDLNDVASDGWYLLGQKEHYVGNLDRANDCYRRADDARGGAKSGYLPAKFGAAQVCVLQNDIVEAKLRLEKIVKNSRNYEATVLLGTLFAEEAFTTGGTTLKEDKSAQRAIRLLESARVAWKDSRSTHLPDATVLLNLARLYETEHADKALQCLLQVEQMEINRIAESEDHVGVKDGSEDQAALRNALREFIPPQLTNNIGCLYFQASDYELAGEMFEAALSACMRVGEKGDDVGADTDGLITTIGFNLGRSYEARNLNGQAIEVYERLLKEHSDYTDARARLAYINLCQSPQDIGPLSVTKLHQEKSSDSEVRALYGWYLGKLVSKRTLGNTTEDPQMRHRKHTLQKHDKHDRYALVGMGTLYLECAREMRRGTDQEKQKRSAMYSKAVEFFDKVLELDSQNAYAAQGIAIALIEDKMDFRNALLILNKVRHTIKDAYVLVNLGHIYNETKQYSRAIESYEIALSKMNRSNDPTIFSCLGQVWLNKGKVDRDLDAYQMALEYSEKAVAASAEQIHLKFNVAFVQIQLATAVYSLSDTQRSLGQVQDAANGLESAIDALEEIAAHPQCPYPKHDVDQRADMARNTLRKQLERAIASQKEYEEKTKEQLRAAVGKRQAELRRREEKLQEGLEKERQRLERIKRQRGEITIRDRILAEKRHEGHATAEADMKTDSETGEKVRRKRTAPKSKGGKRLKKTPGNEDDADSKDEPLAKKRRLTKKESTKYKSAEIVVDSDDGGVMPQTEMEIAKEHSPPSEVNVADEHDSDAGNSIDVALKDEEPETGSKYKPRQHARRTRIVEESGEDE